MSVQNKSTSSKNNPVSVTIGSVTYSNVVSWSDKIVSTDGGYMEEPRTTAGSDVPHGYTDKPKYIQISIALDSNVVRSNLISAGFINLTGSNGHISTLRYVEKNSTSGQVRTVTFNSAESGACKVMNLENKFVHGTENPVVEITLAFYGSISESAWANPT